jgi:hypothetical protein
VRILFALGATSMLLALYGRATLLREHWRMWREGVVHPIGGLRIATGRHSARLAALTGAGGTWHGLIWARTRDGIVCRAAKDWVVIGHGRQAGGDLVVDVRVPRGLVLTWAGTAGFAAALLGLSLAQPLPGVAGVIVPPLILAAGMLAVGLQVLRARRLGLRFPRHVAAMCAEAAGAPPVVLRDR